MKKLLIFLLALLPLCGALAEETDGDAVWRMVDADGRFVTSRAAEMFEGDECITGDNTLYRVVSTNEGAKIAVAENLGQEPPLSADAFLAFAEEDARKKIAMYSTHSDESYEQGDGASSKSKDAGIYDVGDALAKHLSSLGIEVTYSHETHLPHDTGAYRRSRQTAEELLKDDPDALIDIHRDGIPDENEYKTTVDGENISKVRLLVGRANPNATANRNFAKALKTAADEMYPGLIKDIYIGKGNYNQELYPRSILLEFGTHTIDKEKAVEATKYMADVIESVVFGGSAKAETEKSGKGMWIGIGWVVGLAALAAVVYALATTGKLNAALDKLKRTASEVTGGSIEKKRR